MNASISYHFNRHSGLCQTVAIIHPSLRLHPHLHRRGSLLIHPFLYPPLNFLPVTIDIAPVIAAIATTATTTITMTTITSLFLPSTLDPPVGVVAGAAAIRAASVIPSSTSPTSTPGMMLPSAPAKPASSRLLPVATTTTTTIAATSKRQRPPLFLIGVGI